jgi:mono/diheme cytochrome c family protein
MKPSGSSSFSVAAFSVAWVASACQAAPPATAPDFIRDVRPILAEKCLHCHGADEQSREGGLRLDLAEAAAVGGDSGEPAIVGGDPDASQLIHRITTTDESERMPPVDSKPPLTEEQIDIVRRWIAAGAPYQKHWALIPPEKVAPPIASSKTWGVNEVDDFVFATLQREQLSPSPAASRAALLRRLHLDLIGFPPSPAEVKSFLADEAPDAYEKQVDRLLRSEHFGEKWARHWLDVARYADSDGYEKDLPRKQHHWRDWVVDAINSDMPYDKFVIEQVAGDLLPNATQSQRVATGFLRNGMVNEEGAIIYEQFRMEGLIDRLDCLGKAVMGLTVQCAQCHTHKYDEISHEEYYRLMAFLNDDYESVMRVHSDQQREQIQTIERESLKLEDQLKADHPEWGARFAAWQVEAKQAADAWSHLPPIEPEWIGGLAHPEALPDHSVITLGFRPTVGDLVVMGSTEAAQVTALRFEALTHGDLPFNGPGRSPKGTFAVSEVVVEAQPLDKPDAPWEPVVIAEATASFAQSEQPIGEPFQLKDDKRVVGPAKFLVDGKNETAWGADRGPGRRHQDLTAHLRFEKAVAFPNGTRFKIKLVFAHGGDDAHGQENHFLGRFRLSTTGGEEPLQPLPRFVVEALNTPAEQRTDQQNRELFTFWREADPTFAAINAEIDKLWSGYPDSDETVLNLAARSPEHRRQTAILDRGDWQKPTTPVTPGVPAALHPITESDEPARLRLARWLVDRRSPTAARVAVNRVWQSVFGIGLVETSEDFGVRASAPSHPELLDWLAVDFMEHDWSLKHIVRTIVTSETYRQQSGLTDDLRERDPNNRLLARGPRFRLDAEAARDSVLAASGLLNLKRGGPSFFPPVPESMFTTSFIVVDFWKTASAPERYRRSFYMFRRRSMPDPVLAPFDAPNGDFACARRTRSNTPLAALTSLNEIVFVEAARALALRMLNEAGSDDRERAAYAFELCTNRRPNDAETDEILSLLRSQRQRLADGWISPRAIATGDHAQLPKLPEGVTPADAAAWTVVARVLLNLDETLTKG